MEAQQPYDRYSTGIPCAQTTCTESLPLNLDPEVSEVAFRPLVTGASGGGRINLHHVRIDPGCATGNHVHAGMVKIHEVPAGAGTCTRAGTAIPCTPMIPGVMPSHQVHDTGAGDRGCFFRHHSPPRSCEAFL